MTAVISIDLGTSGCRSAVYDSSLKSLSSAAAGYPLLVRSETQIEQDAEVWWECVKKTIRQALASAPVSASDIKAISISAQGIAFVPIDREGNVLHPVISWMDSRGEAELGKLRERYGEEMLYRRTGKRLSPAYTLSKLMWFQEHQKELYERAWRILFPLDFIQYCLSGECVCDHTIAGGTMLYHVERQCWDRKLLGENHLSEEKLPKIAGAGTVVGKIRPGAADELGLTHEVLIVNGAQDQKCAALGAGAEKSAAAVSLGTGCCISRIADRPIQDPSMRIPIFPYVYENTWDLEGVIQTAGSAYAWFQRELGGGLSFNMLNQKAAEVEGPSSVRFYPYLSGGASPWWSENPGSFTGLSLMSGIGHLTKAIFEGIAYHIRANLEVMAEACGYAEELRLFGGGSKSALWCQVIADITNTRVVRLASSDTALAGAAKLAFLPLGCDTPKSLPAADVFLPDAAMTEEYEKAYEIYKKLQ